MLCFVKKVLEKIKDFNRLRCLWRSSGPRIIFLESLVKNYDYWQNYDAEMNNSAVEKNEESCKKNFEDEANNKQLDKVKDDTQWSNLNQ